MAAQRGVQTHQAHGGGVQGDGVAARQNQVQSAGFSVYGPASLHSDDAIHQRQSRPQPALQKNKKFVQVLVMKNPIVLGQTAPLILERARKVSERMRLQN